MKTFSFHLLHIFVEFNFYKHIFVAFSFLQCYTKSVTNTSIKVKEETKLNDMIKREIRQAGLFQYQIADKIGVSEQTLIRWMRYELPPEKLKKIRKAIFDLKQYGENNE